MNTTSPQEPHLYVFPGAAGHQLFGDVVALVRFAGRRMAVVLPVPIGRVRVHAGRRGVRHPGRGHQPHGLAPVHRPIGYGPGPVFGRQRPGTVVQLHLGRHADRLVVGLHARQVRGGRARRIGHLFVHAIRLKRNRREPGQNAVVIIFRARPIVRTKITRTRVKTKQIKT